MKRKKFGDRRDAALVRDLDAMHFIMPVIYPNRSDNEAFISERIDLTAVNDYLAEKNKENPEYKYNLFQIIVTAVLKTVTLRPKMNRFIANKNLYQRNEVSAAFVVKKQFSDSSEEGLAFIHSRPEYNLDSIHNEIYRKVSKCRRDEKNSTDKVMDLFNKLPRFIAKAAIELMCMLDRHGKVPQSFIASDPFYSSVVLSNLGSIKLRSGYHHLTNWGTTSVFVVIGEKKLRPYYNADGSFTMRDSVDLGLTVDERIADGYYFSKTIRLLKKLLENPQLLEDRLDKEVEY
ncbi:MAG: 2-oxo acid dehydrogenase subunit E2 [Clostridiales bacterium]|nr:2-oxo acid dehydrogenase subunit E2 [Clostridiales bacterium]